MSLRDDFKNYQASLKIGTADMNARHERELLELMSELNTDAGNPLGRLRRYTTSAQKQLDHFRQIYPRNYAKGNFLCTGLLVAEVLELRLRYLRYSLAGRALPERCETQGAYEAFEHEARLATGKQFPTETQVARAVLLDARPLMDASGARTIRFTATASMLDPGIYHMTAHMPVVNS